MWVFLYRDNDELASFRFETSAFEEKKIKGDISLIKIKAIDFQKPQIIS